MPRNIGMIDRVIRAVFGLAAIAYFLEDGMAAEGLGLVGFVGAYLLATAIFLYCPLYDVLGLSTRRRLDRPV